MTSNIKYIKILYILSAILILGAGMTYYRNHQANDPTLPIDIPTISTTEAPPVEPIRIYAQVSGAVYKPGIYKISENLRTKDLIEIAGGVLPEADLDKVNLVAKIKDGKRINIPSKKLEKIQVGTKPTTKVHINTATAKDLQTLPGIGQKTAETIVAYRQENGPFQTLDGLSHIKGLGPKTLEKIKPLLLPL
ncbi:MAG: ComEA family DNA-binding protein [Candidatus Margulisbacteria bacterium]|nr:ComEA family DNA-binding protein [Candidatus Margulisiibacteriota bacterium]